MIKEEILARLTIKNFSGMTTKQRKEFLDWLKAKYTELSKEKDPKIFAKNYKATLYK